MREMMLYYAGGGDMNGRRFNPTANSASAHSLASTSWAEKCESLPSCWRKKWPGGKVQKIQKTGGLKKLSPRTITQSLQNGLPDAPLSTQVDLNIIYIPYLCLPLSLPHYACSHKYSKNKFK
jgi:hypothetical protein